MPTKKQLVHSVAVEVDYLALGGFKALREATAARLRKEGVAFDEMTEAKYLAGRPCAAGFAALCEAKAKTAADVPTIIAETMEDYRAALEKNSASVSAEFKAFLSELSARKFGKVLLISALDPDKVHALLPAEVADDENVLFYRDPGTHYGFTSWDTIRRAFHKVALYERLSVMVAASGFTTKAAINTGMSVAAFIAPETEWQDFSGADVVLESVDKAAVSKTVSLLRVDA